MGEKEEEEEKEEAQSNQILGGAMGEAESGNRPLLPSERKKGILLLSFLADKERRV